MEFFNWANEKKGEDEEELNADIDDDNYKLDKLL